MRKVEQTPWIGGVVTSSVGAESATREVSVIAIVATAALTMGFLTGLLADRRSGRQLKFCRCGVTRVCPLGHAEDVAPTPERAAR